MGEPFNIEQEKKSSYLKPCHVLGFLTKQKKFFLFDISKVTEICTTCTTNPKHYFWRASGH